jgi:hypothetical protein
MTNLDDTSIVSVPRLGEAFVVRPAHHAADGDLDAVESS